MTHHPPVSSASGFFSSLFDLSFRTFITPRIIRILYVLSLVLIGIWALVFLVGILASFDDPFTPIAMSVVLLLLWPLGVLFAVVYARVLLEFVMVVFRIGESTEITARSVGGGAPPPAAGPAPGGPGGPPAWGGPGPTGTGPPPAAPPQGGPPPGPGGGAPPQDPSGPAQGGSADPPASPGSSDRPWT